MKTVEKLPESVTLSDGLVLKHRTLNAPGMEHIARQQGLKFRVVGVKRKDLNQTERVGRILGEPVKAVEWIFTDKPFEKFNVI